MFAGQGRVCRNDAHAIGNAAALLGLQTDFVAIRAILLLAHVLHREFAGRRNMFVLLLAVDQLDIQLVGCQRLNFDPGAHGDALAQAELPVAASIHVEFQARPDLLNFTFPGCQRARLLITFLFNLLALLNLRYVEARSILLDHAPHTESRRAGADRLAHQGNPAVRQAIFVALEVQRDDLILKQGVEREAIGLVLRVLIVVLALLADGPAILPVVALGPPAIQNATVRQAVQRSLLSACSAGLMGTDWIIQPQVSSRNQVAGHIDVVVLQKGHLAPEGVAARELVDLLDQSFARLVGGMRLPGADNLHRASGIAHNLLQAWQVTKDQRCPFIGCEAARKADNQRLGTEHLLKLGHLQRALAQAQMVSAQPFARVVDQRIFALHVDAPELGVGYLAEVFPRLRLIDMLGPILAQIVSEKLIHLRADPGGGVDAVSDRIDRHLVNVHPRPEKLPHLPRDIAVQRADAIVMAGQAQC